jgi:PKD repeat protein
LVEVHNGTAWSPANTTDGWATWTYRPNVTGAHGAAVPLQARAVEFAGTFSNLTTINLTLNDAPVAAFTASPASPTALDDVAFQDQSTDEHLLAAWHWDFGDGTNRTSANATHRFTAKGDHTVTLNVTDDHGAVGSVSRVLRVLNSPKPT